MKTGIQFSFIPAYQAAVPVDQKVVNFTYTVFGDFGMITASEPSDYAVTQAIQWNTKYIKFRYPSEHTLGGKQFALEMQIFHGADQWALYQSLCVSGVGVISVFFDVSTETPPVDNPFFSFLNDKTTPLDLSMLFTPDISLNNYIAGYIGTSTVPNCERAVCYYLLNQPFSIGPDQLAKLKVEGVTANVRRVFKKAGAYK